MHHHRIYLFTYLTVHIFSMFPLSLCCEIVIFFVPTGILGPHLRRGYMTIPLIQVLAAIMITVITITIIGSEEEKKLLFFFASIFFSWQEMCLSQSSIFPVCFIPTISCSSKSIIAIATKRNNCLFCTNVNKTRIEKNS